ncbi:MAG: hypothetical protein OEW75_16690 [Cyclobacteriaceae bacterium]|nr:hypothetical protein [Cyclobacteriaceae bacterium]
MITYANGTRELIPQTKPLEKEISIPTFTPKQMYRKGQEDANLYYKGNGAFGQQQQHFFLPLD